MKIIGLLLLCAICFGFPQESKADATVVGSVPIQLGVPVPVTLGSDQLMQFTFTPDQGMRVNIWQDYDSCALVHIAPAYLESNQEHWSSANRKGVKVSLNPGETYTFEVLIPAHLPGGSFNVYLDLVGMENTSAIRAELESMEVTSGFSKSFVYGNDGYGEMRPEGYAFYPFSPLWWEGLTFDLIDSAGGRTTVCWEDLEWPVDLYGRSNFAKYEGEPITFHLEGKTGAGAEIVMTEPEVLTGVLSYKGIEGRFSIEVLAGEGSEDAPSVNTIPEDLEPFGTVAMKSENENTTELSQETLEKLSNLDNSLELQMPAGTIVFDSFAVHTLCNSSEGGRVSFEFVPSEIESLTDQQQAAIAEKGVCQIVELRAISKEDIHDFGGGCVTVRILFDGEPDKGYVVVYVAEDGNIEEMETVKGDGYVEFTTEHFSIYAVLEKQMEQGEPEADEKEEPEIADDSMTDSENENAAGNHKNGMPWGVIGAIAVIVAAAVGIIIKKKK